MPLVAGALLAKASRVFAAFAVNALQIAAAVLVFAAFRALVLARGAVRGQADARFLVAADAGAALLVVSAIGLNRAAAAVVHVAVVATAGLFGSAIDAFTIGQAGDAASAAAEFISVAVCVREARDAVLAENAAFTVVRVVDGVGVAAIWSGRTAAGRIGDIRCQTIAAAEPPDAFEIAAAIGIDTGVALRDAADIVAGLRATLLVAATGFTEEQAHPGRHAGSRRADIDTTASSIAAAVETLRSAAEAVFTGQRAAAIGTGTSSPQTFAARVAIRIAGLAATLRTAGTGLSCFDATDAGDAVQTCCTDC